MWVTFLRSFPGDEAHIFFAIWGPKTGISGGGQQVNVEKVYVLFLSLTIAQNEKIC